MESRSKKIFSLVFILTPLLAVLIICLVTQTNLLQLDAYDTSWNDEINYMRTIRIIRSQGLPTGVAGYNEMASELPAYGSYTILTYIPYLLISFITGISSHNFIYFCNVIMILVANIIFTLLVKPTTKQSIWLALFSGLSLVYERFVWSGMSEASHCAFAIIILGCSLWLFSDSDKPLWKERTIIVFMIITILYFGMIRPFQFAWLLIPIVYLMQHSKSKIRWIQVLGIILAVVVSYGVYRWLSANWSAPYFSENSISNMLTSYLRMFLNGQIGELVFEIIQINIDALKTIFLSLREFKFVGVVVSTFFIHEIILFTQIIRDFISKDKKNALLVSICFLIGVLIYEANILLYSINQCHRMLLSFVIFSGYLICVCETTNIVKGGRQVLECILIVASLIMRPSSYALPQDNEAINVDQLEQSLYDALPFDNEDKWGNTIAKNIETNGNFYVTICLPLYMNGNTCTDDYLEDGILNNTLISKYIMLSDDHRLNKLCEEKYEIIWRGDDHTIYLNSSYMKNRGF